MTVVDTSCGKVRGAVVGGVWRFFGVPYGQSTAGSRRFRPPEPARWGGTLDAVSQGPRAPQENTPPGPPHLIWNVDVSPVSEDCLRLNVWTRHLDAAAKLPVMVFLHGGGFRTGSSGSPIYDGHNLATRDVVLITVNHRLNVFGFLSLGDVSEQFSESGNVGMLDIVAALRWVRDNVRAFGGDPDNVTIFGQSGGGSKVGVLMAMPAARGLFHRAIAQSPSSLLRVATSDEARLAREHLLIELFGDGALGPDIVARLENLPVDQLVDGVRRAVRRAGGVYDFRPMVDGHVLQAHPFEPEASSMAAAVPLIIGWCETEQRLRFAGTPAILGQTWDSAIESVAGFLGVGQREAVGLLKTYRAGRPADSPGDLVAQICGDQRYRRTATQVATLRGAAGHSPTYVYRLSWRTPVAGGSLRSPHTLCLPFSFANVDKAVALVGRGREPRALQDAVSGAWVAFARTGVPYCPSTANWSEYRTPDRTTMIFDVHSRPEEDPGRAERLLLETMPGYAASEVEGGRREDLIVRAATSCGDAEPSRTL
ncbi:carboxylesterase/lipase family protein [Amycolatopsis rubida]|uniref:Carboxylic ester hydrolase n=1 Tax=Amycolatopsis rubida TaxID=112413 RepID=A0ABX0C1R1_9PSEU|nr:MULTISPECIES: carboxylesterase family protein [Amycolatopsis]MYW96112.1 carboxylesterase family protein [Amycolatopsis rubida]NEC61103.1 carboxylesterase/lipase family protein [Amycolatopsis rubida]OAP23375.1 Para-nitrobenzyl esterase [Amycolatopsis sp. M39]